MASSIMTQEMTQEPNVSSILSALGADGRANRIAGHKVIRILRGSKEISEKGGLVWLNGSTASQTALPGSSDVDLWITYPEVIAEGHVRHSVWKNRREVALNVIRATFGDNIEERKKCIYVHSASGDGVELDFTVAQRLPEGDLDEKEFWTLSGERIVTSPSRALRNITNRDARTGGAYRSAVLALKHAKVDLISSGDITKEAAPGFHLLGVANALTDNELISPKAVLLNRAAEAIRAALCPDNAANILTIVGTHHNTFGNGPTEWCPDDALVFADALSGYASSIEQERIIVA